MADLEVFDLPNFEYKPLAHTREVRILVLHTGQAHDSPLRCTLEHLSRPDVRAEQYQSLDYTALSYVWGNAAFTTFMICNGRKLPITAIVESMLRSMRSPSKPRRLWLDAVCLNQNDLDEKRQQVPLMGEIYAEASRVRIWLGSDEKIGRQTISALRRLKSDRNCPDSELRGIRHLLQHPWFSRRWTIQEAKLHADAVFQSGRSRIGMGEAFQILLSSNVRDSFTDAAMQNSLERIQNMQTSSRGVLQLMWDYHSSECSDPRDRIAALQGLVVTRSNTPFKHTLKEWPVTDPESDLLDPEKEILWLVDYEKDWINNFSNFTAFLISRGFASDIEDHLGAFGSLAQVDAEYPWWVPNWSRSRIAYHKASTKPAYKSASCIDQVHYVIKMCKDMFAPPTASLGESPSHKFHVVGIICKVLRPSDWLMGVDCNDMPTSTLIRNFDAAIQNLIGASDQFQSIRSPMSQLLLQRTQPLHRNWPTHLYGTGTLHGIFESLYGKWHFFPTQASTRRLGTISENVTLNDIILPLLRYRMSTHSFFLTKNDVFGMSAVEVEPGDTVVSTYSKALDDATMPLHWGWFDPETQFITSREPCWVLRAPRKPVSKSKASTKFIALGTCYDGQVRLPRSTKDRLLHAQRKISVPASDVDTLDQEAADARNTAQSEWRQTKIFDGETSIKKQWINTFNS